MHTEDPLHPSFPSLLSKKTKGYKCVGGENLMEWHLNLHYFRRSCVTIHTEMDLRRLERSLWDQKSILGTEMELNAPRKERQVEQWTTETLLKMGRQSPTS
jgi:hypothetical protein